MTSFYIDKFLIAGSLVLEAGCLIRGYVVVTLTSDQYVEIIILRCIELITVGSSLPGFRIQSLSADLPFISIFPQYSKGDVKIMEIDAKCVYVYAYVYNIYIHICCRFKWETAAQEYLPLICLLFLKGTVA